MSLDLENFEPLRAALGGALIGLSASWLLFAHGRIAGISGILAGLVEPRSTSRAERTWFLLGLLLVGLVGAQVFAAQFGAEFAPSGRRSLGALLVAGLLVGYGTRLGNGCTSGHGVCGLSRFSQRSLVAVVTFMLTAGLTVFVIGRFFGGSV
ncbi:MAG TPA: YeeE/YedE thiosulfate transporter family protein [Polyangiaceae bacterium]|nr:YeeE/YedE thiosulfate transporter family protein [Polyangiaceae bacterium]